MMSGSSGGAGGEAVAGVCFVRRALTGNWGDDLDTNVRVVLPVEWMMLLILIY